MYMEWSLSHFSECAHFVWLIKNGQDFRADCFCYLYHKHGKHFIHRVIVKGEASVQFYRWLLDSCKMPDQLNHLVFFSVTTWNIGHFVNRTMPSIIHYHWDIEYNQRIEWMVLKILMIQPNFPKRINSTPKCIWINEFWLMAIGRIA